MKNTLLLSCLSLFFLISCGSGLDYMPNNNPNNRQNFYPKVELKVKNKKNNIIYGENNIIVVTGKQINIKHITLTTTTGILVKVNEGWIYNTNSKNDKVVRFTVKGVSSLGRKISTHFDYKIWGIPEPKNKS